MNVFYVKICQNIVSNYCHLNCRGYQDSNVLLINIYWRNREWRKDERYAAEVPALSLLKVVIYNVCTLVIMFLVCHAAWFCHWPCGGAVTVVKAYIFFRINGFKL